MVLILSANHYFEGRYLVHDEVRSNPLFDGLNTGSIVRLQSILQRLTILPGRTICTQGETGTAMYMVENGTTHLSHALALGRNLETDR